MTSFSTAVAAFRSGRLREAEEACRQVLCVEPRNADAYNLLGVIAGSVGDHAGAAELMQRSVAIAPDVMEFRSNLAKALMAKESKRKPKTCFAVPWPAIRNRRRC